MKPNINNLKNYLRTKINFYFSIFNIFQDKLNNTMSG